MSLPKPTFTASFYVIYDYIYLSIHNPGGAKGVFDGFEVLMKTGVLDSETPWRSVVNLTAQRPTTYSRSLSPLTAHALTVRGLKRPNTFSEMADPVTFRGMDRDKSTPRNVRLEAIDSHTVHMTWDPPAEFYDGITDYIIFWLINEESQDSIKVPPTGFYNFTGLEPGQNVSASVCAHSQLKSSPNFEYIGVYSALKTTTTPEMKGDEEGAVVTTGGTTSTPVVAKTYKPTQTPLLGASTSTGSSSIGSTTIALFTSMLTVLGGAFS
ncbi:Oncosphere antigen A [Echinococcus granulosus]|nr:Oncosphere antigen A [Echinococcus granulosus]